MSPEPVTEAYLVQEEIAKMYGPAAVRKKDFCRISEVADMYPAFLIGSRAVAMMGIRTRHWSH